MWNKQDQYVSDLQDTFSLHMELQAPWMPAEPMLHGSHCGAFMSEEAAANWSIFSLY